MAYECLLLLGVLSVTFMVPHLVLGMVFNVSLPNWLVALNFFGVVGAYFVWYWNKHGQTLAMQTWRIKVVRPGFASLPVGTAMLRYLLAWLWVVPAILLDYLLHLERWHALYALLGGVLAWSLTAFLDKDRQFLHDKLAGTRLVQLPKPEKQLKQ